ncbi:MAG: helicase associated domain-containing protein [Candidatus Micrarchaeia archaeon]|jgi:hypothetical protein
MAYWASTMTYGRISGQGIQDTAYSTRSAIKRKKPASEGILLPKKRGRPKKTSGCPAETLVREPKWKRDLAKYLESRMKHGSAAFTNKVSPKTTTHEQKWEKNFEEFLSFIIEHGCLPSRISKDEKERHLHSWRWLQAAKLKKGKLSESQLAKLNEALFFNLFDKCPLKPVERQNGWNAFFSEWVAFKKEHGREPSQAAKNSEEKRLGSWCCTQRIRFNHSTLAPERIKVLSEAGFDFGEGGMWDKKWGAEFAKYTEFKIKQGRAPVDTLRNEYERKLARWLNTQRALYRKGKLLPKRKALLEKEGLLEPM